LGLADAVLGCLHTYSAGSGNPRLRKLFPDDGKKLTDIDLAPRFSGLVRCANQRHEPRRFQEFVPQVKSVAGDK
jgi:hypothetical protein